jgi:hypothetical protein
VSTALEKAIEKAQAALTVADVQEYDGDSWDIFVGNQMQIILDAAAHLHDGCFERGTLTADYIQKARADALDVEVLVRALNDVALRDRSIDSFDAVPVRVLAAAIHRAILAERQP